MNETENETLREKELRNKKKMQKKEINVRAIYKIRNESKKKRRIKENDLLHCKIYFAFVTKRFIIIFCKNR